MGRPAEFRANGGYKLWEDNADYVLIPLALIFLAVLLIPLAVPLTPAQRAAFFVANILIWAAFAVDYFARLYLAPERGRFVRTHVLDFIVVCVPFLRPLRLLRVVGIVGEYVMRSRRHLARRAMAFVIVVAVVTVLAGAAVIFNAEHNQAHANIHTFSDALFWSVGAITTVGTNGDPTTGTGRIMASVMFIAGVALAGIFTAAVATYFLASHDERKAAEPENLNVAHELATIRTELAELRALLGGTEDGRRGHASTNTTNLPADETGRTDDAVR
jgi:voltage-gated potassium channel